MDTGWGSVSGFSICWPPGERSWGKEVGWKLMGSRWVGAGLGILRVTEHTGELGLPSPAERAEGEENLDAKTPQDQI